MQTSSQMRQLIGSWEGCRLEPYQDAVGVWTQGYGHTGADVFAGCDPISQETAELLLEADLRKFEGYVANLCPNCTQQQFDALVSFTYNLGQGSLAGSSLRRLHNAGNYRLAALEFGKWNHAGGQVLPGLTRRREGEQQVYATGTYADSPSSTAASNPDSPPTLRIGSTGGSVTALQQRLGITADGIFGPATEGAVKAFQGRNGIDPDGIVGPATRAKLGGEGA